MASVLTAAPFTRHTLTYRVRGAKSGVDALGNDTFTTTTGTLTAFVTPRKNPHLHQQPGSDPTLIPVIVELDDPLTLPTGIGIGSALSLTWEGQAAVITITTLIPNDIPSVAFGTYLEGGMRVG